MNSDQLGFPDFPETLGLKIPEGLVYRSDFLTRSDEDDLAERIAALPLKPLGIRGFLGKRRTVSFGWTYRFDGSGLVRAEPIPHWLQLARERVAAFAGHRDRPIFGDVAGLSLLAPAPLRFRRKRSEK